MKKLEKDILLKAYDNHELEGRKPVHFRVVIRAYIDHLPVEATSDEKLISGIRKKNWLKIDDINSAENMAGSAKIKLDQYLKSHHIEGVEPGRTRNIKLEIFLKTGFVFSTSKKIYEKSKAEDLMREWQDRGLSCFIMAELTDGANLYAPEALSFTKYADLVKTDHLVVKGHQGRVPGTVELCFMDEDEDIIHQAKKTVDAAFQGLEKAGLVILVRGYNLCFDFEGITLTRLGTQRTLELKEQIYQEYLSEQAAKAEKKCKIKCLSCGEIIFQTSSRFRSDKAVNGDMIEFPPDLSQAGWSIKFGPSDIGDSIVCPNCETGLIDSDSFRFKEGVLIPIESEQEDVEVDVLNLFLSTMCVEDPAKETMASELYDAYQVLAKDKNKEPMSKKAFGLALAERGFLSSRASGGVRMWTGIGLRDV